MGTILEALPTVVVETALLQAETGHRTLRLSDCGGRVLQWGRGTLPLCLALKQFGELFHSFSLSFTSSFSTSAAAVCR